MRNFRSFSFKRAHYRISSCGFDTAVQRIVSLRRELDRFIFRAPWFLSTTEPLLSLPAEAPGSALEMHRASCAAEVGPMAAVAGTFAQEAVEAALEHSCTESIVENGGDIFLKLSHELTLGVYAGETPFGSTLAFRIKPEQTPLAVCSSSSTMGHSLSFGNCDLVTVFSSSGALADAAATCGCNLIKKEEDIDPALDRIMKIGGVLGLMIIKGGKIGLAGDLPELVRNADPDMETRITRDADSNFFRKAGKPKKPPVL